MRKTTTESLKIGNHRITKTTTSNGYHVDKHTYVIDEFGRDKEDGYNEKIFGSIEIKELEDFKELLKEVFNLTEK